MGELEWILILVDSNFKLVKANDKMTAELTNGSRDKFITRSPHPAMEARNLGVEASEGFWGNCNKKQ